jgi:hypothetical protein
MSFYHNARIIMKTSCVKSIASIRDPVYYNRAVQKCSLSDPRRALVTGRFLGILFILSFCH